MDNNTYIVTEKPENVSYDDLYKLIYDANEINRQRGIRIITNISNGDDLKRQFGPSTMIYVVLKNRKLVGTFSVRIEERNQRFLRGLQTGYMMHLAVISECRGQGIGKELVERIERYGREKHADVLVLYVVDRNPAKKLYSSCGFVPVDFIARTKLKQNTVGMVKWLTPCPYPKFMIPLYFKLKQAYVRIRYRYP